MERDPDLVENLGRRERPHEPTGDRNRAASAPVEADQSAGGDWKQVIGEEENTEVEARARTIIFSSFSSNKTLLKVS